MVQKTDHNQIRLALIQGVIATVADYGLEGMTTKRIAEASGQNEAYIYRYFFNREDLLEKTFFYVEDAYFNAIKQKLQTLLGTGLTAREILREEFFFCWEKATQNAAECKFFNRYYNSAFFVGDVRDKHEIHFVTFLQLFQMLVEPRAYTVFDRQMTHIAVCLLDYANKVAMGVMPNGEKNKQKTYEMLETMVQPYLIKTVVQSPE